MLCYVYVCRGDLKEWGNNFMGVDGVDWGGIGGGAGVGFNKGYE